MNESKMNELKISAEYRALISNWAQWAESEMSRTRNILFSMVFCRTNLRRGLSGAKFDARFEFEVHLAVAPQKPGQTCEKLNFSARKMCVYFFPASCRESFETRFDKV